LCKHHLFQQSGAQTFRRQTELIRVLGNEEAAVPCEAFSRPETLARAAKPPTVPDNANVPLIHSLWISTSMQTFCRVIFSELT